MIDHDSTSRTVKAGGLTLHYHEAGPADAGAPVVIMLHGGGPGASGWSNFGGNLPVFAEHFRTLLVDQPCFGASDKPELDKDFFSFSADAVAALMDELGISRAHFIGNSLGGGTSTRMALNHPDKVDKLLLMGPGGISSTSSPPTPPKASSGSSSSARPPSRPRTSCAPSSPHSPTTRPSSPTS